MNAIRLPRIVRALRQLKTAAFVVLTTLLLAGAGSASALTINLTYTNDAQFTASGLTAADIVAMKNASAYAASLLTAHFTNNINVNIFITAVPGTSTLGGSSTSLSIPTFTNMRNKLLASVTTPDDVTATSTSPIGSVPAADPQPAGHWLVSRAQAKALGLSADNAVTIDGTFTFGGGQPYTYDPFNRQVAGKFDYIAVALHEFTEIMGRIFLMGQNLDGFPDYMLLDMFHFSAPGTHLFASGAGRYFSIDNGTNNLKAFNNFDLNGGDAQDYASGANDSFNAFSGSGVRNELTEVGLRNMDVIGYNRLLLPVALDATNLTWTTGGTNTWLPQILGTHDGVDAAKSGAITNNQSSFVEATVTGPVNLSFFWKVSSETNFDFLSVTMDGNLSNRISGEVGYVQTNLAIPAGSHAVRWTYSKDNTASVGQDTAWLDQVTTSGVNVAPVLASIEAGALAYSENQAATAVSATITATDSDSANLASGSVSITANFASGQDVLALVPSPQNGITGTYNAGSGVLTLSGSSSVANYQAALRSVRYSNTSESPSTATRTVTFLVNDGTANSNPQARNITVASSNDLPVLAAIEGAALGYTENQAATAITATITASDLDNANFASGSVSITGNFISGQDVLALVPSPQNGITGTYNAGSGVLSLSGSSSVANYQAALRSVTYFNSSENPSSATRTVSFVVNDGAANSVAATRNITVTPVNDAPVLANIEAGALPYAANQAATPLTATLTASDVDSANLASGTVSITANFASGQDVLALVPSPQNGITGTYNAGSGVLTLSGSSSVANYQAALRSVTYFNSSASPSTATRTVSFVVNDGAANSNPQTRNINVTGAGLIPPVTPTNGGIATILLFRDDESLPSAYKAALDAAGLTYQYFIDEATFNAAVAASSPPSTLAIVDSISDNHNFAPLVSFVANCGRAIVYHWDLDSEAALAAAFNVTVVQDIFTPEPINDWAGSFFFSHVTSPMDVSDIAYNDNGDKLQPTPGGVAVAGHTAAATNGQACVVIGNSGRTIVNSMALQDVNNATHAAQFALNEIFYLLAPAHGGGRVAVLGAETTDWNEDVRQKLLATAAFETVDIIQPEAATPTLAQLRPYSALLVYSDNDFDSPTALGNVLADYVDAGGGLVVGTFALYNAGPGLELGGRIVAGGYLPFVGGGQSQGVEITLVPDQASHPILAGVGSFSGGSASFHNVATLAPNSALVAHWNNGVPLVMTKVTGQSRVVGLNFFPVSETMRNDLWRTNSAGGLLMANALRWSALPDCTLKTNYVAVTTFTDHVLSDGPMGLAFDGTNFWSIDGGGAGGNRLARYTAAGGFLAAFAPGIDFRSAFTDAGGRLYARGFNSPDILRQTTPGTFVTHVTLSGGSLDSQSAVVLNGNANEYIALNAGTVGRWNTNGSFLGNVTLAGFGNLAGENSYPQNVRIAAVGNSWLTYDANRVLSVWNQRGSRIATTTLQNAGTGFDPAFSFSYCAGKVFVVDAAGGLWRGYDICTSPERPYLSNPVRVAGGQFRMDLHAPPARSYTIERTANFTSWTPVTTLVPLAPNTTITDGGATGTNLFYRARTP